MTHQRQSGLALFLKFIRWYAPYFEAYSFVLARSNEYEADRCAAQLAGAESAAQALIQTQAQGRFVADLYWPNLYRRAAAEPAPPAYALMDLSEALRQGPPTNHRRKFLTQALQL